MTVKALIGKDCSLIRLLSHKWSELKWNLLMTNKLFVTSYVMRACKLFYVLTDAKDYFTARGICEQYSMIHVISYM